MQYTSNPLICLEKEFDRMHRKIYLPLLLVTLWTAVTGLQSVRCAPYPVEMESRLRLDLRPMTVQGDKTRTFENRQVTITPDKGAVLRFTLDWPGTSKPAKVKLWFHGNPSGAGESHQVTLDSQVTLPGEQTVTANRVIHLDERSMRFVEIYARGDIHLTLALELELTLTPVVQQPSGMDRPVEFNLQVARISGEETILLETDTLRTFLGQPVTYSFRRGAGSTLETVQLELLPMSIEGNVLQARVTWTGEIQTGTTPLYLSRSETILTSRSAASEFHATVGEPPEGYSFTVTPGF